MRQSTKVRESAPTSAEPAEEFRIDAKKMPTLSEEAAKIPHDPINEQVIIAAAMASREQRAKLVKIVSPDGFYGRGHRAAWEAIVELERRGLDHDAATIRQVSNDKVDAAYLESLAAARPTVPANLAYHVECWLWDRRRIGVAKGILSDLLRLLQDPTAEPDAVRRAARSLGGAFDGTGSLRFLRDSEAVVAEMEREVDESVERHRGGAPTYPYGLEGLDFGVDGTPRLVPGAAPQNLTLIVGYSGAGKTTFTNQFVLEQIARGRRVLHGAWEQKASINLRLLSAFSLGLSRSRLFTGGLSDEEREALKAEGRRLGPLIQFFDLPFDQTRGSADKRVRLVNETNLDTIHEHVELSRCDVAVFDLFHQALVETEPSAEKRALDRMQAIAKSTGEHLALLHHLNKGDLAGRADKRPTRDSIRGGTHWINAFDTILGLHIPALWKSIPMTTMEAHVLKQRYGRWPIAIEFDYDADTGLVSNGREFVCDRNEEKVGGVEGWLEEARDERPKGKRR